jgi:hypothetical protein
MNYPNEIRYCYETIINKRKCDRQWDLKGYSMLKKRLNQRTHCKIQ